MRIIVILFLFLFGCNDIGSSKKVADSLYFQSNKYYFMNQDKSFYNNGIKLMNEAIFIDSNCFKCYYRLAWFYNEIGNIDSAIKIIRIITKKRSFYNDYFHLGVLYEKLKNDTAFYYYRQADKLIQIAIKKRNNDMKLRIDRFKILLFLKPKDEVIREMELLSKKMNIFPLLPSDSNFIFNFNRENFIKEY